MRQREKELSGTITNLLDTDLEFVGNNHLQTTIPVTSEYGAEYQSHFDNSFEPVGEIYARLNGCFQIYYPKLVITATEKAAAMKSKCEEPCVPKYQRGQGFYIVTRETAIKATMEGWDILPQLLIPANPIITDDQHFARGFVLASLLVDKS